MIRFQFVDDAKKNHSVKRLCEVLKLNRSSYYKWKKTSTTRTQRLLSDAVLGARVKAVFKKERGCYGSKRIAAELNDNSPGNPVNHKKVARIMRSLKLFGYSKKRKVTTTVSEGKKPVFPDLVGRRFTAPQPNQVYVGPIRSGCSLTQWSKELAGFFDADGANNGGTEASNGLIELHRRDACGFRNRDNHRLRMPLIGGGPDRS